MISEDTICAISTPAGSGAIAVIRLSGTDSKIIVQKIFNARNKGSIAPNRFIYGDLCQNDKIIDEVVVAYYKAPNSYTGEDIIEVSCHGSVYIQQKILTLFTENGARLATPGEFTQRAFLNNKLDLSQAEGVADIIASSSAASHRIAMQQMKGGFSKEINDLRSHLLKFASLIELELDFGEEDVEFANRDELKELIVTVNEKFCYLIDSFKLGNVIKNGIPVAIIGPPNAGKSTLLNALLNDDKAIVTDIPGTTRDVIEDTINLNGYLFRFIDTAGIRKTQDKIETLGIGKTIQKLTEASVILAVIENADDIEMINTEIQNNADNSSEILFLINKIDVLNKTDIENITKKLDKKHLCISASNQTNLDQLIKKLTDVASEMNSINNDIVVTNVRHYEALSKANNALKRASEGLSNEISSDLMTMDIREAIHYLGEITGEITTDEILGNIFKNFCIGK